MDDNERHVLTIDKPNVVRETLKVLSEAVQADCRASCGICMRFRTLTQQGCESLILNLRVLGEPVAETSSGVRICGVSLLGGVLSVSGQATNLWILRLKQRRQPRFLPLKVAARLGAFMHALF